MFYQRGYEEQMQWSLDYSATIRTIKLSSTHEVAESKCSDN